MLFVGKLEQSEYLVLQFLELFKGTHIYIYLFLYLIFVLGLESVFVLPLCETLFEIYHHICFHNLSNEMIRN
jgi:hypothetical protein